jgi:outer membrane biosynthesis protein TonB
MSSAQRIAVWNGERASTTGGLKKSDLKKNRHGRIVSKKKSEVARKLNNLGNFLASKAKAAKAGPAKVEPAKPKVEPAKPKVVPAKPKVVKPKPKVVQPKPKVVKPKPKVVPAKPKPKPKPKTAAERRAAMRKAIQGANQAYYQGPGGCRGAQEEGEAHKVAHRPSQHHTEPVRGPPRKAEEGAP